jgi:hypothetical protein
MKLKQIDKLCKSAGRILLFDEQPPEEVDGVRLEPRQWMSDGEAVYPLDGVPYLDQDAVHAIFDIDAKKADKLHVQHNQELPKWLDFGDFHESDTRLEPVQFKMSIGSDELTLFRDTDGGLIVIKADYRKPLDNWKECECFKRMSAEGNAFVAVMSGCVLRALISTYRIGADLVETLGAVYNAAGVAAATGKEA